MFQTKLANKSFYTDNIGEIRLRLAKLQELDAKAQKTRAKELKKSLDKYVNIDRMLHHQRLPFVPKVIWTEIISWHHNNLLVENFDINKTKKLIGRKYY